MSNEDREIADETHIRMVPFSLSCSLVKDLYARMLLTRLVDEGVGELSKQGYIDSVASCRGHEAAQVGSAVCIEVGQDFTLPYYRDLGVVLTIGMTPYEVIRTYLNINTSRMPGGNKQQLHWGYCKHNMVTGNAPVATQILHAAGIAFASKLRKASVVTVAYCGDGAICEPDFLEGICFAAQHQLPAVFICEQDCSDTNTATISCTQGIPLPKGLTHQYIDGTDVTQVYQAMQAAMQHAREGRGPVLLELAVSRPTATQRLDEANLNDPLLRCQQFLQEQGMWDEAWAVQLRTRLFNEVEQAMRNALRNTQQSDEKR